MINAEPSSPLAKGISVLLCIIGVVLVGWFDHLTGDEISFSVFYLFPIATCGWVSGRGAGIAMALMSALVWGWVENITAPRYSSQSILYWNTAVRLCYFVGTVELLARLRKVLHEQRRMSRTDLLSGLWNRAGFYELLEIELARTQRSGRPLALAYIDLDHFKQVNDTLGHQTGDAVLRTTAEVLRATLRRGDLAARVGGDEFLFLLPESGAEEIEAACDHFQRALSERVSQAGWSVGASIGVVVAPPNSAADDLIKRADERMYAEKRQRKKREPGWQVQSTSR